MTASSPPTDTPPASTRTRVLGLPVDALGMDGAVDRVRRSLAEGRRLRVAVTNANKCWLACRDPELRRFLEECDLVVAETAVVWGARLLGRRGVAPAWGIALMERLLAEAEERRWSTYLLGGRADVVADAARVVARRHPRLDVVGHHHGYLDPGAEAAVLAELAELRPDLLFVAMGSPLQERFIARLPRDGGPSVAMGVGGSLDVLARRRRPAPSWVRGSGFEWVYRALQDPRLWRRYAVTNPWFVWSVLRERLTGRVPAALSSPGPTRREEDDGRFFGDGDR